MLKKRKWKRKKKTKKHKSYTEVNNYKKMKQAV